MTLTEWERLSAEGFTPLPGRCVIHLDAPPTVSGSIVLPDSTRVQDVKGTGHMGTVLAMETNWEYQKHSVEKFGEIRWRPDNDPERGGFKVGDRVAVGIHADELTEQVVFARNGQVSAVLG
jgi:hypothetical protein